MWGILTKIKEQLKLLFLLKYLVISIIFCILEYNIMINRNEQNKRIYD